MLAVRRIERIEPKGGFARLSLVPRSVRCGVPRERTSSGSGVPLGLFVAGYPRERNSSGSGVPLGLFVAGYPRERNSSGSGVPLGLFVAGYPRERNSSGSGVPLGLFVAGYPRERNSSGSGAASQAIGLCGGAWGCRAPVRRPFLPDRFSMQGTPAVDGFASRGRGSLIGRRPKPVQICISWEGGI